jgi:hypothetical protein
MKDPDSSYALIRSTSTESTTSTNFVGGIDGSRIEEGEISLAIPDAKRGSGKALG